MIFLVDRDFGFWFNLCQKKSLSEKSTYLAMLVLVKWEGSIKSMLCEHILVI